MCGAGDFANSTAHGAYVDSAGQWLADPAAVLVGMVNGAASKALVKLSSPMLSADNSTLTFQARTRVFAAPLSFSRCMVPLLFARCALRNPGHRARVHPLCA